MLNLRVAATYLGEDSGLHRFNLGDSTLAFAYEIPWDWRESAKTWVGKTAEMIIADIDSTLSRIEIVPPTDVRDNGPADDSSQLSRFWVGEEIEGIVTRITSAWYYLEVDETTATMHKSEVINQDEPPKLGERIPLTIKGIDTTLNLLLVGQKKDHAVKQQKILSRPSIKLPSGGSFAIDSRTDDDFLWASSKNVGLSLSSLKQLAKPKTGRGFQGFSERVENLLSAKLTVDVNELVCLKNLNFEPLPHQKKAVLRIFQEMGGSGLLCDEVGLGKTIEAGLYAKEIIDRGIGRRILIITPSTLCQQWCEEMLEKFDMEFHQVRKSELNSLEKELCVVSLEVAREANTRQKISEFQWDLLVVDEAHLISTSSAIASREIPRCANAPRTLFLTATPFRNELMDFYWLISCLNPGVFSSEQEFADKYIGNDRRIPKKETSADLRQLINQVMIRNTRQEIGILNFKINYQGLIEKHAQPKESTIQLQARRLFAKNELNQGILPQHQRKLARSFGSTGLALARRLIEYGHPPTYKGARIELTDCSKVRVLLNKLPQVLDDARTSRILIFCNESETCKQLQTALQLEGIPSRGVYAGQDSETRSRSLRDFRTSAEHRVLVCDSRGAEGLNLQHANVMINFDLEWDPMKVEQRLGRISRIGQSAHIQVIDLLQPETWDAAISKMLVEDLHVYDGERGRGPTLVAEMTDGSTSKFQGFTEDIVDILCSVSWRAKPGSGMENLRERCQSAYQRMQLSIADQIETSQWLNSSDETKDFVAVRRRHANGNGGKTINTFEDEVIELATDFGALVTFPEPRIDALQFESTGLKDEVLITFDSLTSSMCPTVSFIEPTKSSILHLLARISHDELTSVELPYKGREYEFPKIGSSLPTDFDLSGKFEVDPGIVQAGWLVRLSGARGEPDYFVTTHESKALCQSVHIPGVEQDTVGEVLIAHLVSTAPEQIVTSFSQRMGLGGTLPNGIKLRADLVTYQQKGSLFSQRKIKVTVGDHKTVYRSGALLGILRAGEKLEARYEWLSEQDEEISTLEICSSGHARPSEKIIACAGCNIFECDSCQGFDASDRSRCMGCNQLVCANCSIVCNECWSRRADSSNESEILNTLRVSPKSARTIVGSFAKLIVLNRGSRCEVVSFSDKQIDQWISLTRLDKEFFDVLFNSDIDQESLNDLCFEKGTAYRDSEPKSGIVLKDSEKFAWELNNDVISFNLLDEKVAEPEYKPKQNDLLERIRVEFENEDLTNSYVRKIRVRERILLESRSKHVILSKTMAGSVITRTKTPLTFRNESFKLETLFPKLDLHFSAAFTGESDNVKVALVVLSKFRIFIIEFDGELFFVDIDCLESQLVHLRVMTSITGECQDFQLINSGFSEAIPAIRTYGCKGLYVDKSRAYFELNGRHKSGSTYSLKAAELHPVGPIRVDDLDLVDSMFKNFRVKVDAEALAKMDMPISPEKVLKRPIVIGTLTSIKFVTTIGENAERSFFTPDGIANATYNLDDFKKYDAIGVCNQNHVEVDQGQCQYCSRTCCSECGVLSRSCFLCGQIICSACRGVEITCLGCRDLYDVSLLSQTINAVQGRSERKSLDKVHKFRLSRRDLTIKVFNLDEQGELIRTIEVPESSRATLKRLWR